MAAEKIAIKRRNIPIEKLQKVAEILKAISHPIRLEILEILECNGSSTVTEIREKLATEIEQSLLSHHLIKMKDKGVLRSQKQGKFIYYAITDPAITGIFDCMEKCSVF